jgi:hypothetical protein
MTRPALLALALAATVGVLLAVPALIGIADAWAWIVIGRTLTAIQWDANRVAGAWALTCASGICWIGCVAIRSFWSKP